MGTEWFSPFYSTKNIIPPIQVRMGTLRTFCSCCPGHVDTDFFCRCNIISLSSKATKLVVIWCLFCYNLCTACIARLVWTFVFSMNETAFQLAQLDESAGARRGASTFQHYRILLVKINKCFFVAAICSSKVPLNQKCHILGSIPVPLFLLVFRWEDQ